MVKTVQNTINVLFTAAEADPYVKIGGLGDVAGSLPFTIHQYNQKSNPKPGIDIRLVLPLHQPIREKFTNLKFLGDYQLEAGFRKEDVQVYLDTSSLIPVYFLDGNPIRNTSGVYSLDSSLDAEKFIFYSLALLKLPDFLNWKINILHANDWHTATSIFAMKTVNQFQDSSIKTILSIHNLPYLGEGSQHTLSEYHIPSFPVALMPSWAYHLPLPLGMATADLIIPVSPGYAKEIQTDSFGCGLERLLQSRSNHVLGIINGINEEQWDPSTDPFISANYDADSLDKKMENKKQLLQGLGLNVDPYIPLIIMITRMDRQKGVDIAVDGLYQLTDIPWQAIILGSGDPILESKTTELQNYYPDKVKAIIGYKSELSHQLYAAGDIFIMPSRYEPCGISQMISMRYGVVPVAHATGGLIDTITPVQDGSKGTGYLYQENTPDSFSQTLRVALDAYKHKKIWYSIQKKAMSRDFSWEKSAAKYIDQYNKLASIRTKTSSQEKTK